MKRLLILLLALACLPASAQEAMNTVPCRMDGTDCAAAAGAVTSVGNGTIGSLFAASWATATTTPALSLNFAANALLAADTVPLPLSISAQSAYPQATTNVTGANLNLAGGLGRRFFTIVSNAALATKTITLTANGTLVTLTASAGAPAANQFGPIGTDDTAPQILVTSTALAAAITAHATLGPLMTPTVAAGVVYLTKQPTLNSLAIATGTAGALVTATSGADGVTAIAGQATVSGAVIAAAVVDLYSAILLNGGGLVIKNAAVVGWTNDGTYYGTVDTFLFRASAGTIATSVGTGTATANIGGTYAKFVSGAGVGNGADTTNDALWTLTPIPANTFTANGDALVLTLGFNTGATANSKGYGVVVGGNLVANGTQNANNEAVSGLVTITRVDATHVNVLGVWGSQGSPTVTVIAPNLAVSDLTTNTLAVVVTASSPITGAANDVLLFSGVAEFKK